VEQACEPSGEKPTLELGKGTSEYLGMDAAGGGIEVIHGPQGGYHVDLGLEARYLDPSSDWTVRLTGEAGDASAESTPFVTMRCNQQVGRLQSWGQRLIWDVEGPDLDGRTAAITAVVTDAAGTELSAEVTVELFYPDP
jgi:hypothetical protein